MKRKLINYEVFEEMEKNSLSSSERELVAAEDILAKSVNVNSAKLRSFGANDAIFETNRGTYIHANYVIENNQITFDRVEELVIDEATEKAKTREFISGLLESLLDKNEPKANELFKSYMSFPAVRRNFTEAVSNKKPLAKLNSGAKDVTFLKGKGKKRRTGNAIALKNETAQKLLKIKNECLSLSENVLGYVNFRNLAPVLKESLVRKDDKENVVAIRIPTTNVRLEARVRELNWKSVNHEVKNLRENAKFIQEDLNFCKAVENLRTQNAISDAKGLQEALEAISMNWPSVLYLTQDELAQRIGVALEAVGFNSFDDQMCGFMAEGILTTAHELYSEKAERIMQLADPKTTLESDDAYAVFQDVVNTFYKQLDEATAVELNVFKDLYSAMELIYKAANDSNAMELKSETASYLRDLAAVLNGEVEADVELAETVANWINDLIETNLGNGEWTVSNTPHQSPADHTQWDHPITGEKARKSYSPDSDFQGSEKGASKLDDDGNSISVANAKKMGSSSWGNVSNGDTYPGVRNPYLPKSGDFTMKGDKGADKDKDTFGDFSNDDVYPSLKNPYLPKDPMTSSKPKMDADNLVVDK